MELQERMEKTVAGQVTWADPTRGKTCNDCRHSARHPKPKEHKPDVCNLVKIHTGKIGEPYAARKAIACSMFSE
jgi:hypothetical protein